MTGLNLIYVSPISFSRISFQVVGEFHVLKNSKKIIFPIDNLLFFDYNYNCIAMHFNRYMITLE